MDRIDQYLLQSRVVGPDESPDVHYPPLPVEARALIAELTRRGVSPVVVGSCAVFNWLKVKPHEYRPTADLDLHVTSFPGKPMTGWRRDETSMGVLSWISPSKGYVDFLIGGQHFPNGSRTPLHVRRARGSQDAHILDLIKMKMDTWRSRDLSDVMVLIHSLGRVPSEAELGKLTKLQRETLQLVNLWFERDKRQLKP